METTVNFARNLDGTLVIHAIDTPALVLDQQRLGDA
jgi:hypothetical protein